MKIVVPTDSYKGLEDRLADHFGRCQTYTFLNAEGEIVEIIDNTSEHMGGSGLPPELMKKHGAEVLLCRDLGPKALTLCEQLGMKVYVFPQAATVKEAFKSWQEGKIRPAGPQDACEAHQL